MGTIEAAPHRPPLNGRNGKEQEMQKGLKGQLRDGATVGPERPCS